MKNHSIKFLSGLKNFDMTSDNSGLVYTKDIDKNNIDKSEKFALYNAKKYKADAVYFRRFPNNNRPSIPQIYIYNYTTKNVSGEETAELHRKLWCNCQVPLIFIFTKTEVKIFNSLQKPEFKDKEKLIENPLTIIQLASTIDEDIYKEYKKFSAKLFDNGTFWENSEYKSKFKQKNSVYENLLFELKSTRKSFIDRNTQYEKIVNKLLVLSIFIKYLEERSVIPAVFFQDFNNSNSFVDVIKNNVCIELFDELSKHFNGEIFELTNEEKNTIKEIDLIPLIDFLEGKSEKEQYVLWSLYSFDDLPIELISNIYEEFLVKDEKNEGIVYTPPHLVQFLIDESMPLYEYKKPFKILDPACGSGIFLVGAYKRIVQWWRINNEWKNPELNDLKDLLYENIYGIDLNEEAVRVAIFSLSLALCDMLTPTVIWDDLKFKNFREKNLIAKDFFEAIEKNEIKEKFDLIIGNPPFLRGKNWSDSAKRIENGRIKNFPEVPGKHLAMLFLDQAMHLTKKGSLTCLILPAGALLYNDNSIVFRKYFLNRYNVSQIIDFTHLSRILFKNGGKNRGDIPTAAIFAKNENSNGTPLLHITVRRTKSAKEKLYFELDHYDFHYISKDVAKSDKYIWKSNYLGGGRISHFISRFEKETTLNLLIGKKISKGWSFIEGFKKKYIKKNIRENKKRNYFNLNKMAILPTNIFTIKNIEEGKFKSIETNNLNFFSSNSYVTLKKGLAFKAPHILIKESIEFNENKIPIELLDYDIAFEARIIGIHSPKTQINDLIQIHKRIKNNKLYLLYIACTSSEFLVGQSSTILKADIENLPWPKNENELKLSIIEEIIYDDIFQYLIEFRRKGENSKIVKQAEKKELTKFGEVYCSILNSVYENNGKKFYLGKYFITDSFVCFPFHYGNGNSIKTLFTDSKQLEKHLNNLLQKESGSLRINRVLRLYDPNVVYLIKPNELRYWLRSIAIRDADETFADLLNQGY